MNLDRFALFQARRGQQTIAEAFNEQMLQLAQNALEAGISPESLFTTDDLRNWFEKNKIHFKGSLESREEEHIHVPR